MKSRTNTCASARRTSRQVVERILKVLAARPCWRRPRRRCVGWRPMASRHAGVIVVGARHLRRPTCCSSAMPDLPRLRDRSRRAHLAYRHRGAQPRHPGGGGRA
ncbi:hypothetical protein ACU4GD_27275 [Cupriavidus basilensis]